MNLAQGDVSLKEFAQLMDEYFSAARKMDFYVNHHEELGHRWPYATERWWHEQFSAWARNALRKERGE